MSHSHPAAANQGLEALPRTWNEESLIPAHPPAHSPVCGSDSPGSVVRRMTVGRKKSPKMPGEASASGWRLSGILLILEEEYSKHYLIYSLH